MQLDQDTLPMPSPVPMQPGQKKPEHGKTAEADITPCMTWLDDKAPLKAVLVCVHGLGLHKGSYHQFGERMAPLGWGVYAVDVRGFGSFQTVGEHRALDFPGCLEDVRQALELVRKLHPGVPVFLVGESMGGMIALRVTALHPELMNGLISSVPGGDRFHQRADAVKVGVKLIFGGNKKMNVEDIVVNRSTEKEGLRQEWLHDPMARFNLAPTELMQFQNFANDNLKYARTIKSTPVLMLQGQKDKLVKQEGNIAIVNEIPSPDSQLILVDANEHLILEEGQFDTPVIEALTAWLTEHLKTPK